MTAAASSTTTLFWGAGSFFFRGHGRSGAAGPGYVRLSSARRAEAVILGGALSTVEELSGREGRPVSLPQMGAREAGGSLRPPGCLHCLLNNGKDVRCRW